MTRELLEKLVVEYGKSCFNTGWGSVHSKTTCDALVNEIKRRFDIKDDRIAELEKEKAEFERTLSSISKDVLEVARCGEERCDLGICVLRRLHLGRHIFHQNARNISMIDFVLIAGQDSVLLKNMMPAAHLPKNNSP